MSDAIKITTRTHDYELTRRFLRDAGVSSGMRVLDIRSGAGNAAFLAAELVGDRGEVVGTDRSPIAVQAARARARERSLANVSFVEGDPAVLQFEQPFDASCWSLRSHVLA